MALLKNRRPGFSRKAQYGIFATYLLAIFGSVIGAILLAIHIFSPATFSVLRTTGAEITAPISSLFADAAGEASSAGETVSAYINAGSKNKSLTAELEQNRTKILEARAIEQENIRLRQLLGLVEEAGDPISTNRLISASSSSSKRIATINSGNRDGIIIGQPVRAANGLIGRILETGPNTARILLISDGNSITPVKRTDDTLAAFATGRGDETVDVKAINLGVNPFKIGDVFVTSGNGGLYTPNIPVAKVIKMTADGAIAQILADPSSVDYVIVQNIYQPDSLDELAAAEAEEKSVP